MFHYLDEVDTLDDVDIDDDVDTELEVDTLKEKKSQYYIKLDTLLILVLRKMSTTNSKLNKL